MQRIYREDIDWLRAIAVLAVLAFHWGIPPFRGGYVGVDIFFVISGVLITGIIRSEMKAGEFSFVRFYERRIRRLLPALYVMVALVALPSFFYLLPSERHDFFKSVASVVTFTSNIFFWHETGYFGRAAEEKPLLHTWSLSVEEQFYLLLPLLIWLLLRWQGREPRRTWLLPLGIVAAALASFLLTHWLMRNGQTTTAFFMSPPRAWEFLAGSLVALEVVPVLRNIHLRRIARIAGLVMLMVAAIGYRDGTAFPGIAALLPCAGAAIFIWAGLGSASVARAVWSPLNIAAFFGRISYSLYLWHWPLFIYARFAKPNLSLAPMEIAALFAVAVALSYASYCFVEQPLRSGSLLPSRRAVFAAAGVCSLILAAVSGLGSISRDVSEADVRARRWEAYAGYGYQPVYRYGSCFVGVWSSFDDRSCLTVSAGKTNVLLWGDSLAAHYVHGLLKSIDPDRVNIMQATAESCIPSLGISTRPLCQSLSGRVSQALEGVKPDVVIISADWVGYARGLGLDRMMADLDSTIATLRTRGVRVVVVGPSIQFRSSLPAILARAEARASGLLPADELLIPGIVRLNAAMMAAQGREGVSYVSVLDAVCKGNVCPLTLAGGVPIAWDHAHLTAEGSEYVGGIIARLAGLAGAGDGSAAARN